MTTHPAYLPPACRRQGRQEPCLTLPNPAPGRVQTTLPPAALYRQGRVGRHEAHLACRFNRGTVTTTQEDQ